MSFAACSGRTQVLEAARIMRNQHVGDLGVVDDPEDQRIPLRIVTDRDIAVDVLGKGLDPSTTSLASLMHTPVVIAHESEDTAQLIGIMTLDDLLRILVAEVSALFEITVKGQK